MSTIEQWADSHQTDEQIAEAIFYLAADDSEADAIWQDPTEAQIIAIWERATRNGLLSDDMCWGENNLHELSSGVPFSANCPCETRNDPI